MTTTRGWGSRGRGRGKMGLDNDDKFADDNEDESVNDDNDDDE